MLTLVRNLWILCIKLFGIYGKFWIFPMDLHQFFLIKCRGFGSHKEAKIFCQHYAYVVPWCTFLENNPGIFKHSFSSLDFIQDRGNLLASFLIFCSWLINCICQTCRDIGMLCCMTKFQNLVLFFFSWGSFVRMSYPSSLYSFILF